MRDNLIFSGIPENSPDDPEAIIKDFMKTQLKLSPEDVNNISFHRAHSFCTRSHKGPRPIFVKFEHFKQKELNGLNDKFPRKINKRWKVL